MPKRLTPEAPNPDFLSPTQLRAAKRNEPIWTNSGRKTKKTPETLKKILHMVSVGYPIDVSCTTNFVNYTTFSKWCRADDELQDSLDAALLAAERLALNPLMDDMAAGEPEAAQWWLTHRLGHKYSARVDTSPTDDENSLQDPTAELVAFITGAAHGDRRKAASRSGSKSAKNPAA